MMNKILDKFALTTVFASCDKQKREFLIRTLNQVSKFYDAAVESNSEYITGEIRMDRVIHTEGTMYDEPCTWRCTTGQYAPLFTRLK